MRRKTALRFLPSNSRSDLREDWNSTDPLRFPSERWPVNTRYPIADGSQLLVIEESKDRNAYSTFLDHWRIGK
jgi:hypothetical protein